MRIQSISGRQNFNVSLRDNLIKNKEGFTIIESIVALFIFSVIVLTFYSLFSAGTGQIIETKKRMGAVLVANERMEIVRSLDFDQIGISGSGYIDGDIPATDQVTVDRKTFYIFSSVAYVDDPYDGIEGEDPDDDSPADYKRVTIKTAWVNDENTKEAVTLVSDFAPPGVEESTNGGTLVVKVMDKDSVGIQEFDVHIENDDLNIDEDLVTDSNGGISLPGAPTDGNDYEISVSKNNYFSIETLPSYPITSFLPVYAHASVTEGVRNIYSIITDLVSNLTLSTVDKFGSPVQNIAYNLKGGIRKGDTIDDPPDNPTAPIFYYDENLDSGSGAENEITGISYGDYTFSHTDSGGNYEFVRMNPANATVSNRAMFYVEPGSSTEESAVFADKNIDSLLVTVLENVDSDPIAGASVRLYNLSLPEPYDVTLTADEFGMVYFPVTLPELTAGSYDLTVQADGYIEINDTVIIDNYTKKEIKMDLS
ncbi:MAG: hypothetical protein A3J76_00120 [Candidatus Moranbacteria bacterium RBG_13_45_13]|nr:MAG: hypothetical protein A3J76_00120 [Candidatus Moranbacteria bacterium RBG_13_45_13]